MAFETIMETVKKMNWTNRPINQSHEKLISGCVGISGTLRRSIKLGISSHLKSLNQSSSLTLGDTSAVLCIVFSRLTAWGVC